MSRNTHSDIDLHRGLDQVRNITLSAALGPFAAGTDIETVLTYLNEEIGNRTSSNLGLGLFGAKAALLGSRSGSLTGRSIFKTTQIFLDAISADAKLTPGGSILANADIFGSLTRTFPADSLVSPLVQSNAGTDDRTFAQPATAGNLIIIAISQSSSSTTCPTLPSGFTQVICQQTGSAGRMVSVGYKEAAGGETLIDATYAATARVHISEWALPRPWMLDTSGYRKSTTFAPYVDLTPTASKKALVFGAIGLYSYSGNALTPLSGYAEIDEGASSGTDSGLETIYRWVPSTSGTYRIGSTYTGTGRFEIAEGVIFIQGAGGSFVALSVIFKPDKTLTFTSQAITKKTFSSAFDVNATRRVIQSRSFSADSDIYGSVTSSLTGSSILLIGRSSDLTADSFFTLLVPSYTYVGEAVLRKTVSSQLLFDADLLRTSDSSFSADAYRSLKFSADAELVSAGGLTTFQSNAFQNDAFN